jgi:hypothetical protein
VFQNSGVPTSGATGTGGLSLAGTNYIIGAAAYSATISANFGQRPFSYTPPTGFVRLNTYNLSDSTIKKGNTVMDATTYTGDGATRSITNAAAFKPDLVWVKSRSNAEWNILFDSVRGTGKSIYSNDTNVEVTNAGFGYVSAFNSNGYSVTAGGSGITNVNGSAYTYVGWQWQAGQGTNTSNTSGSITSTVSVNATAGFSVVTYTPPGSGTCTVGHGLGVAPKMIITKKRNGADNWPVYHASIGAGKIVELNLTSAQSTNSIIGTSAPTSTIFNFAGVGGDWVAYCWAEIAGFSKFGSYTGNGSADGPFVFTEFRPKFILYKNASYAGTSWAMLDSSRNTYNVLNARLFADSSSAEDTSVSPMDFTSNGFKVRSTNDGVNRNGDTIIYMAFAENPFKNANAR